MERNLNRILDGREWWGVKQSARVARENRDRINEKWCIVCGQSAAEDHSWRFHQAGGCLAGPFCSEWCAWMFLVDDDVPTGEHSAAEMRNERRAQA